MRDKARQDSGGEIFRFDEYVLDTRKGQLLKGAKEVPLRPKSFVVLSYLVKNAGTLLSRDQIMDHAWPGVIVTEDSVTQCLIDIRKALGPQGKDWVRTVPRRGYRFEADVVQDGAASHVGVADSRAGDRGRKPSRWTLAAVSLLALAVVAIWWRTEIGTGQSGQAAAAIDPLPNSIAVLAFDDMSPAGDQAYLANGLAEEILNELARIPDLNVIARTSSFAFRGQQADAVTIGRRLNVTMLLEGSVRKDGARLRVTVQLINVSNGVHAWSETYDYRLQDTFRIQRDIAEQVARKILPGHTSGAPPRPAIDVDAQQLLLLARELEMRVRERPETDEAVLSDAIRLYRQAVEIDPDSAVANSRLAGALLYLGDFDNAQGPLFRALRLNPDSSDVQYSLGLYYWATQQPGALEAFERAVELNSKNVDALSAYAYQSWMMADAVERNAELFRRAMSLDPLNLSRYAALGDYLGKNGRHAEMLEVAARVEELFDSPEALRLIGDLHQYTGALDETIAWTLKARNLDDDQGVYPDRLADLYAQIGDRETAERLQPQPGLGLLVMLGRFEEAVDVGEMLVLDYPQDRSIQYALAFAYTATGQFDLAVRLLRMSGLLQIMASGSIRYEDLDAVVTYNNALWGSGDEAAARAHAAGWLNYTHRDVMPHWWDWVTGSCMQVIVDEIDSALTEFESILKLQGIPHHYMVTSMPCFRALADEPRYLAVLQELENRRRVIRNRLPETLDRHQVSLE